MFDRFSMRTRPPGWPIMYQTWDKLLFLHWPISVARLRPLIPARLSIDTFAGTAWIGLTPFTMWGIRPVLCPAVPGLSASHELNVRTYVHLDGVPGVWFLSLDASNPVAVAVARLAFHLPYFRARMRFEAEGQTRHCTSHRTHSKAPPADFEAVWTGGEALPPAHPDSLEFFLLERYCLYAARGDRLYRARIFHAPWPLCRATLRSYSSTMLASHGLPTPGEPPLLHHQAAPLPVEIWPVQELGA
jgi:uncharacterized protein YqjF (DUF2071 family)